MGIGIDARDRGVVVDRSAQVIGGTEGVRACLKRTGKTAVRIVDTDIDLRDRCAELGLTAADRILDILNRSVRIAQFG